MGWPSAAATSTSTDHGLKRLTYARLGIPNYWIVDPVEPSLLALELAEGAVVPGALLAGFAAS